MGLVLLLPDLYSWILTYTPPEMMPGFPEYQLHIALTMDVIFVCSFFVLGGEFWDKLRALFIHKAKAQLPQPKAA